MEEKFVCEQCGSTNIQIRAWVDPNTLEYRSQSGDYGTEDNWCEICEEHVDFKIKKV